MTLEKIITNTFGCDFGFKRLSDVSTNIFDRKLRLVTEEIVFVQPKELSTEDDNRLRGLLQKIDNDPRISEVEIRLLENGIAILHNGTHLFLFK